MSEKISVIIPIYNCEKYLKKCIDSVLNQTYENFEIILINDGSTDNSGDICEQYKKNNTQIKVINQVNSGVSQTRNKGIELAEGNYICFLDSDDYLEKDFFEFAIEKIKKYKLDLLNTGFFSEVEIEDNVTSDKICANEKLYNNYEELKEDLVYLWDKHMLYNIWNKMYKKDIIQKYNIRFPNYNFGEDMDFNMEYLKHTERFYNSASCFYHYIKERKGSITNKYNDKLFDIRMNEYNKFNRYFEENEIKKEDYIEFSARRFIERVIGCIENICGSKLKFSEKYKEIKHIINSEITREALKYAKINSKKMKVLIVPLRVKSIIIAYIMGTLISRIRMAKPDLFNKLKNKR